MEKKTISKLVKPTINEIAKYIPGDSSIEGKKMSLNFHLMNLHLKYLKKYIHLQKT